MTNPQEKVKISLSLAALERLIGGDSELEVELRHQIVRNFTEKHLKQLANSELMSQTYRQINNDIKTEVAKYVSGHWVAVWGEQFGVDSVLAKGIKNEVDKLVKETIAALITLTVESKLSNWDNYTDNKIKALFDAKISDLVNQKFQEKLWQLSS